MLPSTRFSPGEFALLVERHDEALALVDADLEFEVAHAHAIAVEKAPRIALANGFHFAIHVDAVAAHVGQVVHAAFVVDRGVTSRDIAIGVRQNPVVLQ